MMPVKKSKGADDTGAVMALMAESPAEEEAEENEDEDGASDPMAAVAKVEAALAELKLAIGR